MSGGSDSHSSRVPLVVAGVVGILGALAVMWGLGGQTSPDIPVDRPRADIQAKTPTVAPRSGVEPSMPVATPSRDADAPERPLVAQLNTVTTDQLDVFYADCIDAQLQDGETAVDAPEAAPGVYGPFGVDEGSEAVHSATVAREGASPHAWVEIAFDSGSHQARCIRHDDLVLHALPPLPPGAVQVIQNGAGCETGIWSPLEAPRSIPLVPGSCTVTISMRDELPRRYVSDGRSLVRSDPDPDPWLEPDGPSMAEHFATEEARWLAAVGDERHDPASRALMEDLARERFTHFEDVQWRDHQQQVDAVHRAQLRARIPRSEPRPAPVERYSKPSGDDD